MIAGNAVVLKPSELAPLCAVRLAEVLQEAGLPAGVLNLVHGAGEAGAVVDHPGIRAVSFTGSEATGAKVGAACGARQVRVQLEMGGKNPTIVLADANLEEAAGIVLNAAFGSTGQRCTATSRAIVERSVVEAFTSLLVRKAAAMRVGNGLRRRPRARPPRMAVALRTRRSVKASTTGRSTMARDVAVQRWPVEPNAAFSTMPAASSRLASARTIVGFLPPISSCTRT